jgi:hypothetical protein
MQLALAHVSFAHADAVPILSDVTQIFEPGWHGLVGANGAGKTTVLRLLADELEPADGMVRRLPPALPLRLCPQEVERLTPDVHASPAHPTAARPRCAADSRSSPRRSPAGHPLARRAQALAGRRGARRRSGILLLDEPTNHLDGRRATCWWRCSAASPESASWCRTIARSPERAHHAHVAARARHAPRRAGSHDGARVLWDAEERRRQAEYRRSAVRAAARRHLADRRDRRAQAAPTCAPASA